MKQVIEKYLDDTYELNLKTYTTFKLYDKSIGKGTYMQDIFNEVATIFGLEDEMFDEIWSSWLSNKIVEFENKLTDIQYLIYEKTGIQLNLNNPNWADSVDENVEKKISLLLNGV